MPSPVSASDFAKLTNQATVCQRLGALINGYDAMAEFFGWFLNDSGEISDAVLEGMADRMTPIGTILLWSSDILPSDKWLICNGQPISREDYPTLFARVGTKYGIVEGDVQGKSFKVPNLTDRFPMGAGNTYGLGTTGGLAEVKLEVVNIPEHSHFIELPVTNTVDGNGDSGKFYIDPETGVANSYISTQQTKPSGGSLPHENKPPYLAIRYIIKAL